MFAALGSSYPAAIANRRFLLLSYHHRWSTSVAITTASRPSSSSAKGAAIIADVGDFDRSSPPTLTPPTSPSDKRMRALSLYRQLLRGARRMPTPNRRNYVIRRTKSEYRKHMSLVDEDEIEFQLRLADTNLDTVLVQAEHLSRLFADPEYQNYN